MKFIFKFKEIDREIKQVCKNIQGKIVDNTCKADIGMGNLDKIIDIPKFQNKVRESGGNEKLVQEATFFTQRFGYNPQADLSLFEEFGVGLDKLIKEKKVISINFDHRGSKPWGRRMQEHPKVKHAQQIFKEAKGNPEKIKEYWKKYG